MFIYIIRLNRREFKVMHHSLSNTSITCITNKIGIYLKYLWLCGSNEGMRIRMPSFSCNIYLIVFRQCNNACQLNIQERIRTIPIPNTANPTNPASRVVRKSSPFIILPIVVITHDIKSPASFQVLRNSFIYSKAPLFVASFWLLRNSFIL